MTANSIPVYRITADTEFCSKQTMRDLLHSVLGDLDVYDQPCLDLLAPCAPVCMSVQGLLGEHSLFHHHSGVCISDISTVISCSG